MEKNTENFEPKIVSKFSKSQRGSNSNAAFNSWLKKWFPSWEPKQKTLELDSCRIEHNSFNETTQKDCKSFVSDGKHCWHKTVQSSPSISRNSSVNGCGTSMQMVYKNTKSPPNVSVIISIKKNLLYLFILWIIDISNL